MTFLLWEIPHKLETTILKYEITFTLASEYQWGGNKNNVNIKKNIIIL